MLKRLSLVLSRALYGVLAALSLAGTPGLAATPRKCPEGNNKVLPLGSGEDLEVIGDCRVTEAGVYKYGNVNIYGGPSKRASLTFEEPNDGNKRIHFWAKSILIENYAEMTAGTPEKPFGQEDIKSLLEIHLYGEAQRTGTGKGDGGDPIPCKSNAKCGIPTEAWDDGTKAKVKLPGKVEDYFYQYQPLDFDDGTPKGFFGYKVLALSYGGSLKLYGRKGATYSKLPVSSSGTSWARLKEGATIEPGTSTVTIDREVDWQKDDEIVVTTTDYVSDHSEKRTIAQPPVVDTVNHTTTLTVSPSFTYHHNGARYKVKDRVPERIGLDFEYAETRAAVALLSRSIRISSGGNALLEAFPAESTKYHFGGHTVVRQGFEAYEVQGVEFKQLGQGGRIGHYPIHFHMARLTPELPPGADPGLERGAPRGTNVTDCSINESMNRWAVLHATQNVVLARNVGWASIGHGFVLEEGTETDNKFRANIGINARAAVINAVHNPREVPGIWASSQPQRAPIGPFEPDPLANAVQEAVPFFSDYDHPTTFWIMNGWNDFEYNVAAGCATCGTCFWLLPGANSGHSRHMTWESYASMQHGVQVTIDGEKRIDEVFRAGITPLKKFVGNSCVAAMNSFTVNGNQATCQGVAGPSDDVHLDPVPNDLAPPPCNQSNTLVDTPAKPPDKPNPVLRKKYNCDQPGNARADMYYPKIGGGGRFATICPVTVKVGNQNVVKSCAEIDRCANGSEAEVGCTPIVLDHYSTSFNWAQTNFAAVIFRPQWSYMTQSVMSDVQNGGLSIITGGGYTHADAINGFWALAKKSAFIGRSQDTDAAGGNPFAAASGPFNKQTYDATSGAFKCENSRIDFCIKKDQALVFPLNAFAHNQRLFNIYDGPSYQESNAYLDIRTTVVDDCKPFPDNVNPGNCFPSKFMQGRILGLPYRTVGNTKETYLPHAAIAWKQPNGFYYPPAFHSTNLFFDKVDIRHFVIEPLFKADSPLQFKTDDVSVLRKRYSTYNDALFVGFTDIDRQTELNDDDGSLTGYANTISVNEDAYFNAAVEATECASDETAKTSPYDFVTTVVYPGCRDATVPPLCENLDWGLDCTNQFCFGVPLYRQLLTKSEKDAGARPSAKLMGQNNGQRSILTVNNGVYFVDTTQRKAAQLAAGASQLSVFQPNQKYSLFLVFAKPETRQIYQIYVGKESGFNASNDVTATRVNVDTQQLKITPETTWPSTWNRCYNASTGILTVEIDMSFAKTVFESTAEERCRPLSYCKWGKPTGKDKEECSCALGRSDPGYEACADKNVQGLDVCSWAVKDFDCPKGGCYGFSFTLPSSFCVSDPKCGTGAGPAEDPKPPAGCFASSDPKWNVDYLKAKLVDGVSIAGDCADAPVEAKDFCAQILSFKCPN